MDAIHDLELDASHNSRCGGHPSALRQLSTCRSRGEQSKLATCPIPMAMGNREIAQASTGQPQGRTNQTQETVKRARKLEVGGGALDTLNEETGLPDVGISMDEICEEIGPRVYNVVRPMVRSDSDAEDVTQDVLLQVVRKLPTFRGDAALLTWVHRVAINMALSHRRRQGHLHKHIHQTLDDLLEESTPYHHLGPNHSSSASPDTPLISIENQHLIEQAIAGLPAVYQTVFVLADIEGLSNADIGERLGLSLPAVKSRLHRARQLMRDRLAPHFEEYSTP